MSQSEWGRAILEKALQYSSTMVHWWWDDHCSSQDSFSFIFKGLSSQVNVKGGKRRRVQGPFFFISLYCNTKLLCTLWLSQVICHFQTLKTWRISQKKKFPFSIPNLPNINTVELCLKKIFLILFTLFTSNLNFCFFSSHWQLIESIRTNPRIHSEWTNSRLDM